MNNLPDRYAEAKESVRLADYCAATLQRQGKSYVCPKCGSGTRKNRTPAFSLKGEKWHCFSCNAGGDVFDLAGIVAGTEDHAEQYRIVCEYAGIDPKAANSPSEAPTPAVAAPQPAPAPEPDYSAGRASEAAYIDRCAAAMAEGCEGWRYLTSRGVTPDTIKARRLGWDAQRRRVVIPWSGKPGEWYHVDRDVTGTHPHKYLKPKADSVGSQPVNNTDACKQPFLIIVEGMFDALAVESAGYPAIALNGTAWRDTATLLKEIHYGGMVGVMLDADSAGQEHADELESALKLAGIHVARVRQLDGCKDAGEAVESGRAAELETALNAWLDEMEADRAKREEEAYSAALNALRVQDPTEVAGDIFMLSDSEEPTPTGIAHLDEALGGGLRRGVYVLGAGSSLGKTTLTVQIADYIAASGRPVLFVTIEQSAKELVSKSIARMMHVKGGSELWKFSAYDLNRKASRDRWPAGLTQIMVDVCNVYSDTVAPRLKILEGVEKPTVANVRTVAEKMAAHDGQPPVIFIDYLQLLAGHDMRASDKQNADYNVTAIRQLAREMGTTVFALSALNRASYSGAVSLDSFKESGGIEYGADVLLGLEPFNINMDLAAVKPTDQAAQAKAMTDSCKRGEVREMEIAVLKNRNGALPRDAVYLKMDARAGLFASFPNPCPYKD